MTAEDLNAETQRRREVLLAGCLCVSASLR
jgi:hypothetical protein